jgi:hypothetical protein
VRVAAIGDIGGHQTVLHEAIRSVGGDPDAGTLPDDLVVIQVGDLVHKGPDSGGAVALADHMLRTSPRQWIQLFGNHDIAHIGGPQPPDCSACVLMEETVSTLRSWWADGLARLAVAVERSDGDILVTHAGLTVGCWHDLGSPTTARTAAIALNSTVGQPGSPAFAAGRLLTNETDVHAGPCWAEVVHELYLPWIKHLTMPFHQVHGHAAPWNWDDNAYWPGTPASVEFRCTPHHLTRRTTTRLATLATGDLAVATSIDWRLGTAPPSNIWPVWSVTTSERLGT